MILLIGGLERQQKVHLVDWSTLYRPKKSGGLGLRHSRDVNVAFMMKISWGLVQQRDASGRGCVLGGITYKIILFGE